MSPTDFPQSNVSYGPPEGMNDAQVARIPAFRGEAILGSVDGSSLVVVAWKPSPEELAQINQGAPVFITMMGGLVPHYLSTSFNEATTPA